MKRKTWDGNQPDQTIKADGGKVQWSTLIWPALEEVARVRMFGNKKYSPESWTRVEPHRYADAAMRHLIAYMTGQKRDGETGFSHLAHLICCAMFMMWFDNKESDGKCPEK